MMEKILTVVVPTYNMEKYLDRCLSSLIVDEERMALLEVLVVNDGSKDRSSEIAHGYEAKYPGTFKVIDKENGNYGSCINAALPLSAGLYIKILDADDFFDTDGLRNLLNDITHLDIFPDLIISDVRYVNEDGSTCDTLRFTDVSEQILSSADMGQGIIDNLHMHAIMYRTDILRKIGYKQSEGVSYTDLEWTYYPMKEVLTYSLLGKFLYVYNTSREGQTTSVDKHCRDMWMERSIIERMISYNSDLINQGVNNKYLCSKLSSYIEKIYQYYLLLYPGKLDISDLKQFDNVVRAFPECYERLNAVTVDANRLGTVKYIHNWRRRFSRTTCFFILFDLQEKLSKLFHRI